MSKLITAVMLALAMALASPAYAVATWEQFNADPAYQSREAAIADAPRVLRQVGYPEPVISLLAEAMKNPGVATHVTNGMKLDFMRSGKSALWRNVLVKFKKPPRESEKNMDLSAPSEEWTVEVDSRKWTVGIPKVCNNLYGKHASAPVPQASPPPPAAQPPAKPAVPTFVTGSCPDVYILNLRVWNESVRKLFGIGAVIDGERSLVNGFANPADFSRRFGGPLRTAEKNGDPNAKLSETPRRWRISLINTDEAQGGSSAITAEKFLYDVTVTGIIPMRFKKTTLQQWDGIRAVAVDSDVQSPPTLGKTALPELRFFNKLPGKVLGEWDNNPVADCIMNEHSVESSQPVPPLQ